MQEISITTVNRLAVVQFSPAVSVEWVGDAVMCAARLSLTRSVASVLQTADHMLGRGAWRLVFPAPVKPFASIRLFSSKEARPRRAHLKHPQRRLSTSPAVNRRSVAASTHSASTPLLSTEIATICCRCAADFTLPPPPPFPVLSPPLPRRSARFVSDLHFTPRALRTWPAYTSNIHCPLLVDHANLLLALAHLTAARKAKRRLRHMAAVTYVEQQRHNSVEQLSAMEVRARQAIDGALRGGGGRLTPLPGWNQQEVLAVRSARGQRGRQHLRWPHPRFTHHQLKMVDIIERHRAYRDSSEQEKEREAQQHQYANSVGTKAWKLEKAERGYVSPAKWRVPRHLRWLMWKRQQARQEEAARQQRQQQQ